MRVIRIMGERALGTSGYVVCTGDVPKPARRCLWRVIARRRDQVEAETLARELNSRDGRAVLLLDAAALVIVNRAGETVQDNRN